MSQLAFDFDACICGNPLPKLPAYRKPAKHCCYWCFMVGEGVYSIEQVRHMIPKPS